MSAAKKVGGGIAAVAAVGAAMFAALAPEECPRTAACLSWTPPTTYTDNTPIPADKTITYTVYRGTTAENVGATPVGTTTARTMIVPNPSNTTQTYFFAVTATVDGAQSSLSNTASKLVRAPGPTDGRIEGPTDGGIE